MHKVGWAYAYLHAILVLPYCGDRALRSGCPGICLVAFGPQAAPSMGCYMPYVKARRSEETWGLLRHSCMTGGRGAESGVNMDNRGIVAHLIERQVGAICM